MWCETLRVPRRAFLSVFPALLFSYPPCVSSPPIFYPCGFNFQLLLLVCTTLFCDDARFEIMHKLIHSWGGRNETLKDSLTRGHSFSTSVDTLASLRQWNTLAEHVSEDIS